jgi:hypothetical protein
MWPLLIKNLYVSHATKRTAHKTNKVLPHTTHNRHIITTTCQASHNNLLNSSFTLHDKLHCSNLTYKVGTGLQAIVLLFGNLTEKSKTRVHSFSQVLC